MNNEDVHKKKISRFVITLCFTFPWWTVFKTILKWCFCRLVPQKIDEKPNWVRNKKQVKIMIKLRKWKRKSYLSSTMQQSLKPEAYYLFRTWCAHDMRLFFLNDLSHYSSAIRAWTNNNNNYYYNTLQLNSTFWTLKDASQYILTDRQRDKKNFKQMPDETNGFSTVDCSKSEVLM